MLQTMERRTGTPLAVELELRLNGPQLGALNMLQRFGWQLKFIRHLPGGAQLVVLRDPDTGRYALLDDSGELDENPTRQQFRR